MFTHFFLHDSTVIDKPPRPAQPSLLYLVVRDLSYLRKFTLLQFTADKLKIDYIMLAKKSYYVYYQLVLIRTPNIIFDAINHEANV